MPDGDFKLSFYISVLLLALLEARGCWIGCPSEAPIDVPPIVANRLSPVVRKGSSCPWDAPNHALFRFFEWGAGRG